MRPKFKTLFHPVIIFIGVQIAWVILMVIGIDWYFERSVQFQEFARRLRPDLLATKFDWIVLLEGSFLMLTILAGVYLIFVYWNKQAKLNKMQSNFVSSVSHELKSPLASIQLYLETLKYQDVSKEESKDFIETMLADTERLSALIENILESSKSDPKSMELKMLPVKMDEFLKETIQGNESRLKAKGCNWQVNISDSPTLLIDKRMMGMVFNNLLGNALRYSPSGLDLKIEMANSGKNCEIKFKDSGIGIDKKDLKKLFRKFFRVQNNQTQNIEGAGLGLFISKEIVKSHKGKLKVFSEGLGKGTTFTVALPLASAVKNF